MKRIARILAAVLALFTLSAAAQFPPFNFPSKASGQAGAQQIGAPFILAKSAIPFIVASSGSMANNGAISALTALSQTYSDGAWLHLPASAISAGSGAGWYWFVGSSTTAGTVYNSTYTSGPVTRGSQVAFSTTGPGAFTGETTEIAGPTITVPANALGANGSLRVYIGTETTASANNKSFFVRYSGAAGSAFVNNTGNGNFMAMTGVVTNRGLTNSQVGYGWGASSASSFFSTRGTSAVDTTAATTVVIGIQHGGSTAENAQLNDFTIELMYAP